MVVKNVNEVRYSTAVGVMLSFAFLLVVTVLFVIMLPHLPNLRENGITLFLMILGEIEAIGIFVLLSIFHWIYRSYEFFVVSVPLLPGKKATLETEEPIDAAPEDENEMRDIDRFIEGIKYSLSDFGAVRAVEKYDSLDELFSSRKNIILVCGTTCVLYIGSSIYKKTMKIGIGYRPLRKDVRMRNKFIHELEALAKRFEPAK